MGRSLGGGIGSERRLPICISEIIDNTWVEGKDPSSSCVKLLYVKGKK